MLNSIADPETSALLKMKLALWILVIVAGSIGFSFVFACATPFAALAVLAALNMPRRDVFLVIGLAWFANQIIGYGLLGYPQTWDSFAWGGAIGIAAGLAAWSAMLTVGLAPRLWKPAAVAVAFLAASLAYQVIMYVSGLVLPGGGFSLSVVKIVMTINVWALAGLLLVHRVALAAGLIALSRTATPQPATS